MGKRIGLVGLVVLGTSLTMLCGCGRFRGIPTHGGGKRFYIEQELVAATARAVAKDVDVTALVGKRCALYIISMGDQGSGNIIGGRYSWDALIRGSFQEGPTTHTTSEYPVIPTTTQLFDGAGVLQQTTIAQNALNAPSETQQRVRGLDQTYSGAARLSWPGDYRSEAFINPRDAQFLNAVINEALALRGVLVVPPEQAEIDVFVTVDAFGTCRDRFELHVYNKEVLTAKTALSMCAFDCRDGRLVMPPRTSAFEAEYAEEFVFWCGPFNETKVVRRARDLLVDFKDIAVGEGKPGEMVAPAPATQEQPAEPTKERTRPKELTKPLPKPDPSRPEDQPGE